MVRSGRPRCSPYDFTGSRDEVCLRIPIEDFQLKCDEVAFAKWLLAEKPGRFEIDILVRNFVGGDESVFAAKAYHLPVLAVASCLGHGRR